MNLEMEMVDIDGDGHVTYYCEGCNHVFSWRDWGEDRRCSFCRKDCVEIPENKYDSFSRISFRISDYQELSRTLTRINKSPLVLDKVKEKNEALILYFNGKQEGFRMMMKGFLTNL